MILSNIDIPNEIICHIASLVDRRGQFGWILTCRRAYEVVQPFMYTSIDCTTLSRHSQVQLGDTFTDRPDLANLVTSLDFNVHRGTLCWGPDGCFEMSSEDQMRLYTLNNTPNMARTSKTNKFLHIVLTSCRNIKSLKMSVWNGPTRLEFEGHHLAWGLNALRLESLLIHSTQGIPIDPLLASQPTITSLTLPSYLYEQTLAGLLPTDLPILRSLTAPIRLLNVLIPGRPVKDVFVSVDDYHYRTERINLAWLNTSTRPIKRLVLSLVDVKIPIDSALRPALSVLNDVEDLDIRAKSINMISLLEALYPLKRLRRLRVTVVHTMTGWFGVDAGWSEFMERLDVAETSVRGVVEDVRKRFVIVQCA